MTHEGPTTFGRQSSHARVGRAEALDLKALHPEATHLRILGLNYAHLRTADGGDLYLTDYGVPFHRHLVPGNWYEPQWFGSKRQRLEGSGTVYRLPTQPVDGRSIELVVKWSRVGQDVPAIHREGEEVGTAAEFNSPFEEFALVEAVRRGELGVREPRIYTQRPLAIYVPPEELHLWQTGRRRERIRARAARHPGVDLDVLRSYIMLFGWVDGLNAVEAYDRLPLSLEQQKHELQRLTAEVEQDLAQRGFTVADHKPAHFILRVRDGKVRRRNDPQRGRVAYALIDYELLSRTPEQERAMRDAKRSDFLARVKDRFLPRQEEAYGGGLRPWNVLGVDYVVGRSESTGGTLWVVGCDPELFPYFLPERWRSRQVRLSHNGEIYYAESKDRIEVVWRVSRVGEFPVGTLGDPAYKQLLIAGYNSPFEEFALALELARKGVHAAVPLAIYMVLDPSDVGGVILDDRRFKRLRHVLGPDRKPVLPIDHDFITVWAYWRGVEEGQKAWTPISAIDARAKGVISKDVYEQILPKHAARLAAAGMEAPGIRPDNVLLSYVPEGEVQRDGDGFPVLCHCNFELLRRAWEEPLTFDDE